MPQDRSGRAGQVTVVSAALLLLTSFMSWFDAEGLPSTSGWEAGFLFGPFPVLLGVLLATSVVLDRRVAPQVDVATGCLAAALVLVKLVSGHDDGTPLVDAEVDRGLGLFLAALAALGLAAGGVLRAREGATPPRA